MNVMLLPNIAGYGVLSMDRYSSQLDAALRAAAPAGWTIEAMAVQPDLRFGARWGDRIGRFWRYPRAIRSCRADVFHILDHSHAHLARSTPPQRTVMTFHDCIPLLAGLGRIAMPVAYRAWRSFPLRLRDAGRCARVVAVSAATAEHLVEFGRIDRARIEVIHPGVSPLFSPIPPDGSSRDAERAALLREHGLPPDCLLLAHVGTAGAYKNVPGVLRIVQALAADTAIGRRVYLLRVGAAFGGAERDLMNQLGLARRVAFAGRVEGDAALARIYRAADLLLFPSLWEGFGWPPLEAMACGTPPVASNAGALPEVIGQVTPMAPPHRIDELAAIAHALLTDPACHRAAVERGLERAAGFGWEARARRFCELYAGLASG